jgi:hypothetical protein
MITSAPLFALSRESFIWDVTGESAEPALHFPGASSGRLTARLKDDLSKQRSIGTAKGCPQRKVVGFIVA